ncbi:TraB/VirB10 family protein [Shewanella cutis]|uniref:Conjugal transfer protein TraB n=1 Tax=Shewanella cutis TaxID=2766780 RepID=A0ABS9R0B7_9GAMM|nr:TraB/VirB10 family protein [Shewanella sp. PS-2]MCG9966042.1 conjugal transfer protein TraB [Shewanella sp. PS-2]
MKNFLDYFKKDPEAHFENGQSLNEANSKRNWLVLGIVTTLAGITYLAADAYMAKPAPKPATALVNNNHIDFGAVIDSDFTLKDNQSALTVQQLALDKQQKTIDRLLKTIESLEQSNGNNQKEIKRNFDNMQQAINDRIDAKIEEVSAQWPQSNGDQGYDMTPSDSDASAYPVRQASRYLGEQTLPPRPSVSDGQGYSSYQGGAITPPATQNGIDSFALNWETPEDNLPKKRTPENYVPAGSFVTAVVTGGADANAGVNGQGDTVPMVFQTINQGILPNGKPSKLNNCTILGAAYGEISSSRGIVRTTRLSCIFEDEIIDIPVEATVFNYGRNGIRGTAIMKNGKIVQMAGISGILTGLGETGQALSQTTSNSALGSTSTVNGSDALLNLAGSASASVGSKLADYYIKLAEQYHPIIELNPGNTVNIVFLKGFPLDPVGIKEYEEALAQQAQTPTSATAQILNTISNPLMEQMPANIAPSSPKPSASQQYNQQGQRPPMPVNTDNSPFGRAN